LRGLLEFFLCAADGSCGADGLCDVFLKNCKIKKSSYIIRMENKIQHKTDSSFLDYFQGIVDLSAKHGLGNDFFTEAAFPLNMVSVLLDITPLQAALLSLVLEYSGETPARIAEIAEAIKCGSIQLLKYLDEFGALEQKKLIRAVQTGNDRYIKKHGIQKPCLPSYMIPPDVIKALRQGVAYECQDYKNLTPDDFYTTIGDLVMSMQENDINFKSLCTELKALFDSNMDMPFVKNLANFELDNEEMFMLVYFCAAFVQGGKEKLSLAVFCRYVGPFTVRRIRRMFKSRDHKLISFGLIENYKDDGIADTDLYALSRKAKELFIADVKLRKKKKEAAKDLIPAKTITGKELFYSEKVRVRVDELVNLLREKNFRKVRSRLAERKMSTGFTCLFSGPPGTGKTETVYQIARSTRRDIFLVDISETKSMWFGESEKRIKAVFDRYKWLTKQNGLTPILLFNEADGILGKRQDLGENRRGPAQTENTIQNIILQEMEDLRGGILIATTNMTSNLDKAFERRFLYKIEFEKPCAETRAAIWKGAMPQLSEADTLALSNRYEFSGGQIDNIARKEAVSSILGGAELSFECITALCDEEIIEKKAVRIGFINE
jgi:hypothetical protein